jgi:hypothetical protein
MIGAAGNVENVIPGLGLPGDQFQLTFDRQGNLYFATGGKIFKNGRDKIPIPLAQIGC